MDGEGSDPSVHPQDHGIRLSLLGRAAAGTKNSPSCAPGCGFLRAQAVPSSSQQAPPPFSPRRPSPQERGCHCTQSVTALATILLQIETSSGALPPVVGRPVLGLLFLSQPLLHFVFVVLRRFASFSPGAFVSIPSTPSFLLLLFPRHDSSPSSFCHRTFGVMVKNLLTKMFTLRLAFTNKNVYPPRLAFPIYEASSLLP